jgi:hypothetical protein
VLPTQLNDNKLNSYPTVYQIKKEKPNGNQASPIKIEGQTSQWAKKNGQTAIDKRINRKLKIE